MRIPRVSSLGHQAHDQALSRRVDVQPLRVDDVERGERRGRDQGAGAVDLEHGEGPDGRQAEWGREQRGEPDGNAAGDSMVALLFTS